MGRPRVIVASPDADVAVGLIGCLNPKRYRIEHVHDLDEALLRAELVLAHAAVVHVRERSIEMRRRCAKSIERGLSLVLVSDDPVVRALCDALGARHLPWPAEVAEVKRVVFRAVADGQERRKNGFELGHRPGRRVSLVNRRLPQRVLVLVGDHEIGEVMAAVVRSQLDATCDAVASSSEALLFLEMPFDCVIADPDLLMYSQHGAAVARKLARRGVPVIPLTPAEELDVTSAGQLAWALIPQIRRSLGARERLHHAVG